MWQESRTAIVALISRWETLEMCRAVAMEHPASSASPEPSTSPTSRRSDPLGSRYSLVVVYAKLTRPRIEVTEQAIMDVETTIRHVGWLGNN